jgi:protein TonB
MKPLPPRHSFEQSSTGASLWVRGFLLALVLSVHGVGVAAAWFLQNSAEPYLAPGVLQVSWVEGEQAASAPEPEPEIAPQPLPMRPQPVVRQAVARRAPVLAVRSETPAYEGQATVAEPTTAPEIAVAAVSVSDAPAGTVGTTSAGETSTDVTPPRFGAAYLSNPEPEYPPLSRRLYEQGLVTLHIHITPEGKADAVKLYKSSGFARLDQSALDVVWRWRFIPARRGQENVAGWVMVPIRFNLRS